MSRSEVKDSKRKKEHSEDQIGPLTRACQEGNCCRRDWQLRRRWRWAVLAKHGSRTKPRAPPTARVIDIHAHYFPEAYLDLVASDGKRFDAAYYTTDKGWFIKTPAGGNGPLPSKFIDLKARIADMDQQGVGLQAISLTAPMLYWGDAELSTPARESME